MVSCGTIQHFSISALGLTLFSTSYTLTSLSLSVFMESWLNEPVWSDFHQSHWSSVALTTTDQMLGHIPCSATHQIPHTHTRHLFHTPADSLQAIRKASLLMRGRKVRHSLTHSAPIPDICLSVLGKIFSTQKRVNHDKTDLRQNSVNRKKICVLKKFEISPHVE